MNNQAPASVSVSTSSWRFAGSISTDATPQDGYWIVRQRNAHAWAEYWQAGVGWVRVDPTAAVAPDRVRTGRSLQAQAGLVAGAINTLNPALANQLRAAWEGANKRWNQWVLNYSRGQQMDLLKKLVFAAPSWLLLVLDSSTAPRLGHAIALAEAGEAARARDLLQRLLPDVPRALQAHTLAALARAFKRLGEVGAAHLFLQRAKAAALHPADARQLQRHTGALSGVAAKGDAAVDSNDPEKGAKISRD